MSDELQQLIRMANQIADNIGPKGESDSNAKKMAEHIGKFWARPMREKICADNVNELNDTAQKAIPLIKATLS